MPHDFTEWLTALFAGLTAIFTGIMCWLAWRNTKPNFELLIEPASPFDRILATLSVDNKGGRDTLFVDQVRSHSPIGLTIAFPSSYYDTPTSRAAPDPQWADSIPYSFSIAPGKSFADSLLLRLPEDCRFATRVSISLRIVKKSWTMPHRIKVVTAILPANIRKHTD